MEAQDGLATTFAKVTTFTIPIKSQIVIALAIAIESIVMVKYNTEQGLNFNSLELVMG